MNAARVRLPKMMSGKYVANEKIRTSGQVRRGQGKGRTTLKQAPRDV
jgi:hypothetical protein